MSIFSGLDYWNGLLEHWNGLLEYWNGYLSHEMLIRGGGGGGRQGMDRPGTWFCSCSNETLVRQCVFYHCNVPRI